MRHDAPYRSEDEPGAVEGTMRPWRPTSAGAGDRPEKFLLIAPPKLALTFGAFLESKQRSVHYAASIPLGLHAATSRKFDAVVLSTAWSDDGGVAACEALRQLLGANPLLVAIGPGGPQATKARAAGADHCLVEPFDFDELFGRLVNRLPGSNVQLLSVGDLELDLRSGHGRSRDRPLLLMSAEFKLLRLLMEASPWPARYQDLQNCLETGTSTNVHYIRSHICRLRRLIDRPGEPSLIQAHRSIGYSIRAPKT